MCFCWFSSMGIMLQIHNHPVGILSDHVIFLRLETINCRMLKREKWTAVTVTETHEISKSSINQWIIFSLKCLFHIGMILMETPFINGKVYSRRAEMLLYSIFKYWSIWERIEIDSIMAIISWKWAELKRYFWHVWLVSTHWLVECSVEHHG